MSSCSGKTNTCAIIAALLLAGFAILLTVFFLINSIGFGGIQAQLVDAQGGIIPNGDNVLFDTLLNDQSDNISYNAATGEFTITEPGNYYVSWWFAADGAGPAVNITFATEVNGVPYAPASSAIVSGTVTGSALITVDTTPTVVSLVNITGEDAFIPTTPVQANIVILELVN